MLKFLKQHNIEAGVHYPVPLYLQPAYADLGYRQGGLPVTELVADTCQPAALPRNDRCTTRPRCGTGANLS